MVLGECRKYFRSAQDLYAVRYLDRQQTAYKKSNNKALYFDSFSNLRPPSDLVL